MNKAVPRCDVIYELSRSLSCANTGAATHLVELRFLFHAGPPSQPPLTIIQLKHCLHGQGEEDCLSAVVTTKAAPETPSRRAGSVLVRASPRVPMHLHQSMQDPHTTCLQVATSVPHWAWGAGGAHCCSPAAG